MDANSDDRISIFVNGKATDIPTGLTVAGLLERLGVDPAKVAVEVNRRIVRKPDWASAVVANGAEVEVVHFVGGGA